MVDRENLENPREHKEDGELLENRIKTVTPEVLLPPEKTHTFKLIDRREEDLLIKRYQRRKEDGVLQRLYEIREPTLKVWAKRYTYLGEDIFSEVRYVWLKCVNGYEYKPKTRKVRTRKGGLVFNNKGRVKTVFKRTPFNTFLFTSLKNHMSNIFKRKYSKKRVNREGRPWEETMLSIDSEYDGEPNSLTKTSLSNVLKSNCFSPSSHIETETLINEIARGDEEVRDVLSKYAYSKVKKMTTVCNTITDSCRVTRSDYAVLNGKKRKAKKRLKEILSKNGKYPNEYKIINFFLKNKTVYFEINRKDVYILKKVKKAMERYRKKIMLQKESI